MGSGILSTDNKLKPSHSSTSISDLDLKSNDDLTQRWYAIIAVAFSITSIFATVVTIPALFVSMYGLQSEIVQETEFCRMQLRDFWREMYQIDRLSIRQFGEGLQLTTGKVKRETGHWLFGKWVADRAEKLFAAPILQQLPYASPQPALANPGMDPMAGYGSDSTTQNPGSSANAATPGYEAQPIPEGNNTPRGKERPMASPPSTKPQPNRVQEVCCCCQGSPGEPGDVGDDGTDGKDGAAGIPGEDGRNGLVLSQSPPSPTKEPCVICPTGPPGATGLQGPRGPPGPRGSNGISGTDGKRGEPGMEGAPGPVGLIGPVGPQGPSGIPGRQFIDEGPRGPSGKVGPKGPKGLPGCQGEHGKTVIGQKGQPGDPGRPGKDGRKGLQGGNGRIGDKGISGDCQHCPIPRMPPGY